MGLLRALARVTLLLLCLVGTSTTASAQLDAAVDTSQLSPLLKTFSILTAHRPYQGAASLKSGGGIGFEFAIEAILMRMPDDMLESIGSSEIAFFPMAHVFSRRRHLAADIAPGDMGQGQFKARPTLADPDV